VSLAWTVYSYGPGDGLGVKVSVGGAAVGVGVELLTATCSTGCWGTVGLTVKVMVGAEVDVTTMASTVGVTPPCGALLHPTAKIPRQIKPTKRKLRIMIHFPAPAM
jgi:hypothetical protein